MKRIVVMAVAVLAVGCGGGTGGSTTGAESTTTGAVTGSEDTSTTVGASATTTTEATTTTVTGTTAVTTSAAAAPPMVMDDDGVVTIDWDALQGDVFFAPPGGGADPFFFVHTDPDVDGFFFSVEAYTVYGPAWTGQQGDFTIDCSLAGTGICVHFDPDGPGPMGDLGADFAVTGDVSISQADADGFVAEFSNVEFSDGTTIPGPFTVTG
jgi:hypothetical protein